MSQVPNVMISMDGNIEVPVLEPPQVPERPLDTTAVPSQPGHTQTISQDDITNILLPYILYITIF